MVVTNEQLFYIVKDKSIKYLSGPPIYAPPECVKYGRFTADGLTVWSLGVVLYKIVCGDFPFVSERQILMGLTDDNATDLTHFSYELKSLIRGCLNIDPSKRLTLKALVSHPWLQMEESNPT